jgi:hypothetical protein
MRRTFALFTFLGTALFFACNDAGTDGGLSAPSVSVCGKLKDCCNTIKIDGTKQQCLDQVAALEQNASSNPDGTRQACDNAAQGYTASKICGPDAIDPGKGGAAGSAGGAAGEGGAAGSAAGQGGAAGSGAGGAASEPETTDALCSDGKDNDGNGFADCEDFNCASSAGLTVCNQGGAGGSAGTSGAGGSPFGGTGGSTSGGENTAALCLDNQDNDGDKFIDCDDFGCCDLVDCKALDPESSCAKKGSGGSGGSSSGGENTVALCSDGKDNDSDKFIDCDDFDCCPIVSCAKGTSCGDQGTGGSPGGGENTVALCTDGKDNDSDKFIDCDDFDCCDLVNCKATDPDSSCAKKGAGGSRGERWGLRGPGGPRSGGRVRWGYDGACAAPCPRSGPPRPRHPRQG